MRSYREELKVLHVKRNNEIKKIDDEYRAALIELIEKHKPPKKFVGSDADFCFMIEHVLKTGENGTKSIKACAESKELLCRKTWRKDIAASKVNPRFKLKLEMYEEHDVVLSMINNGVYDRKEIIRNSITGALTKLSKQLEISNRINMLKNEIELLKKNLSAKLQNDDWMIEAKRLRASGMSLQKISDSVGKSKSAVAKYTK